MQIKSNAIVKFIVPAVVVAALVVGVKSCKSDDVATQGSQQKSTGPLPTSPLMNSRRWV